MSYTASQHVSATKKKQKEKERGGGGGGGGGGGRTGFSHLHYALTVPKLLPLLPPHHSPLPMSTFSFISSSPGIWLAHLLSAHSTLCWLLRVIFACNLSACALCMRINVWTYLPSHTPSHPYTTSAHTWPLLCILLSCLMCLSCLPFYPWVCLHFASVYPFSTLHWHGLSPPTYNLYFGHTCSQTPPCASTRSPGFPIPLTSQCLNGTDPELFCCCVLYSTVAAVFSHYRLWTAPPPQPAGTAATISSPPTPTHLPFLTPLFHLAAFCTAPHPSSGFAFAADYITPHPTWTPVSFTITKVNRRATGAVPY